MREPRNASRQVAFCFLLLFCFYSLPFSFWPGFPWVFLGFPGRARRRCVRLYFGRWQREARRGGLAQGLPIPPAQQLVIMMTPHDITGDEFQFRKLGERMFDPL